MAVSPAPRSSTVPARTPARSDRRPVADTRRSLSGSTRRPVDPLASFGILAVDPRRALSTGISVGSLVLEIRARIPEFVGRSYLPKRISDFIDYLRDRNLALETRVDGSGNRANYLVDSVSRRSVPAADVDSRLSIGGVVRMFGVNFEKEAENRYASLSDEEKRVVDLRRSAGGRFLEDNRGVGFESWSDLTWSSSSFFKGETTACGNELWVGEEFGVASDDPIQNLAMVQRARASGIKIIPPVRSREDAMSGRFVVGMPVLVASTATRLRLVDPRLSSANLSKTYGSTIFDHFEKLARDNAASSPSTSAPSNEEFRRRFVKKRRSDQPARMDENVVVRHETDALGAEMLAIVHPDGSTERFDPARLQAGRYRKEDMYGMPSGYLEVSADRTSYAHLDDAARLHNDDGPATVSFASGRAVHSYAIDGKEMSKDEWMGRHATPSVTLPEPGAVRSYRPAEASI